MQTADFCYCWVWTWEDVLLCSRENFPAQRAQPLPEEERFAEGFVGLAGLGLVP
jgi:hypothetical protein